MKVELVKYILRNLNRKRKQTFFTALCVLISSLIILGNTALNNGIQYKLKEGISQALSGQLIIYKTDDSKINIMESQLKEQKPFYWNTKNVKQLQQTVPGLTVNNRIRFGSLVSYGEETSYINIHAIENDHLERMKKLLTVQYGAMPENDNGMLISETLAKDLHCSVGDTLLLVADNINGYMSDEVCAVKGIFEENGFASFLAYSAFIPYNPGKEIVQLEDENSLEVIMNTATNEDISNQEMKKIKAYLTTDPENLSMATWDKTIPLFYAIANIWKSSGYFTQIIFIVFSLIILTNLTSLVIQSRKKEFGTLLAIGFTWRKITLMISMEYLIIGIFSILLSFMLINIFNHFIPETGFYIPSKDMQQALMTEFIRPYSKISNLIYVLLLFSCTIIVSILISIFRIKKINSSTLMNNN